MFYVVNMRAQSNGDHEVHRIGCRSFPKPENRKALGEFSGCVGAVAMARRYYPGADGCAICCPQCHTR